MQDIEAPRVGLALEGLETSPDLAPTVVRMQRLGAEVLVLTERPEAEAQAVMAAAELPETTVLGNLTSRHQKRAALENAGAWGYAGTSRGDIAAARDAGVRAIALAESGVAQKYLWRSGADTFVPLADLPQHVRYRNEITTLMRAADAERELNISGGTFAYWLRHGTIPTFSDAWKKIRIPRTYVTQLAAFAGKDKPTGSDAELVKWQWQYEHGTYAQRTESYKTLEQLHAAGELYIGKEFAAMVGYDRNSTLRLVQAGFLKAIRVSHSFYIPSAEAHAKKAIMDSLLKDEVAQRLGLQPNTILYLHRRGKIPAVMTPYGLRFDPQDVLEYQQRHAGMRAPEVRAALHIQQNTLRHLCEQGKLPYTMRGGRRVFDPEAVQQYKERCNT